MKLSKKEIKYLSSSFQAQSPMSIFANIEDTPDGSEYQSLVNKGIIIGDKYEPKALELLMLLAKPEKCARFIYQNSYFIVEKYTYRVGDQLVLAENNEGEFEFSRLADISELSLKFSELFGMSGFVTSDIQEIFTPGEIEVVLAMVDISRKKQLASYVKMPVSQLPVTADDIISELASGYENGLVEIFLKNYKQKAPEPHQINAYLDSLIVKNVVSKKDGYSLNSEYAKFARSFLIPESITMYEAMDLQDNGEVAVIGRVVITAGLHEIVSFLFDGSLVEFNTISATQLLTNIEDFMSCPEMKQEIPAPAAAPAPSPAVPAMAPQSAVAQPMQTPEWICPCGRSNTGNFCANCGKSKQ
ncbi:MAG: hypothetical protein ACYCYI_08735 [Saccharofermentanales bacterium]